MDDSSPPGAYRARATPTRPLVITAGAAEASLAGGDPGPDPAELMAELRRLGPDLGRDARSKLAQLEVVVAEQIHELRLEHERLQAETAARARAEAALRDSEARYALAAAGAHDGLWDWDLATGVIYFSPRWKALIGLDDAEMSPAPDEWFSRVHADDLPGLQAALEEHIEGRSEHFQAEYRLRHHDGQHRWMSCRGLAVREAPGRRASRLAGSQTDITDRRLAEARLRHDALHDGLTGLPNRALLIDRLRACLHRARRNPAYRFAVLFADLDHFKRVNDSLGHAAGDMLLVEITRRFMKCVRTTDTMVQLEQSDISRLGGDEFVVLLDGLRSEVDVLRVAERMQQALSEPFMIEGQEVWSGVSIGIAPGRPDYERPEDVLRDADTALYQAKSAGRGSCLFFDGTMHASAMSRWSLENALRGAIDRRELRLVYQPIVSLVDGELREFEALLRWHHPVRGHVSPADFIPIAEETGLILPIGEWIIQTVVDQLAAWGPELEAHPNLSIAVNVSGKQLSRSDVAEVFSAALKARGVPGRRIRIEVTESALMERGLSPATLGRLADLDVKLHLDDFGTGYSSLGYLHQLPVNALKIDRSFVNSMMVDATSLSIVQSIISLAHNLGAQVIAEGVERVDQLEQLRRLSCDLAQGYHFSRPLEVAQAAAFLSRWAA
ncbi:MAG TPA: EAL domain-containing protein, partial [Polyangia bacterium]